MLPGEGAFNVTVYNNGTLESSETTMNVSVDGSLINMTGVPRINAGDSVTFSYAYSFAVGNHTVKAEVDPGNLNDESNEYNNIDTEGVSVASRGDLNSDGTIDMTDIYLLLDHVGNHGDYEAMADVNCDGSVNMGDVILLLNHVGNQVKYKLDCCEGR